MPLEWHELSSALTPSSFSVMTVPDRLERLRKDPWRAIAEVRQRLRMP
jgi:bifunctional non-homologous end joining protein LigD